jgi:hypothetical protein
MAHTVKSMTRLIRVHGYYGPLFLGSWSLEPWAHAPQLDLLLDPRTDDSDQGICTPFGGCLYRRAIRESITEL